MSIVFDQPIAMTSTTAPAGFAELYNRHYDAVFRAALRVTGNPADAEDVLQTISLRVLAQGGAEAAEPMTAAPAEPWTKQCGSAPDGL
jgi:DNA-directed RNA polymerase specialized sigma24 family protein